jgi:hypothetical protein
VESKLSLTRMLARCRVQQDGFVSLSETTPWRIGAVLFARRSGTFAVVRKAPVPGGAYEFAGLYALPGGMARVGEHAQGVTVSAGSVLEASLLERVHREAGLATEQLRELMPAPLGPIVTSYTAKGQQRFTLVVPLKCEVEAGAHLKVSDGSVDESSWMDVPPDWERFAPANCIAIAHLLWNEMDADQRAVARPHIDEAIRRSAAWATSIRVAPAPPPWAHSEKLTDWHSAWPS